MTNIASFSDWTPMPTTKRAYIIYGGRKSGRHNFCHWLRLEMIRQKFKTRSKRLKRATLI